MTLRTDTSYVDELDHLAEKAQAQREAAIDRLYMDAEEAGYATIEQFSEGLWDETYERTRYERWTSLSEEEKELILEASEEEAGLRWDAGVYQRG